MLDLTALCVGLETPWSEEDWRAVLDTWQTFARADQLRPPGPFWLNRQRGRASGKTREGSEYVLDLAEDWPWARLGIAGQTHDETVGTLIYGDGGIMKCARNRGYTLEHNQQRRRLVHPSGAEIFHYSGDNPKRYRGPQWHFFWADELAYWTDPENAFRVLDDAVRLPSPGIGAHGLITCTPDRRGGVSRMLRDSHRVRTTYGSTFDNLLYVDKVWLKGRIENHGGEHTSSYREEILGMSLDDGAAFDQRIIDETRKTTETPKTVDLRKIMIGIDPAAKSGANSDETGIVIGGVGGHEDLAHFYVLADATTGDPSKLWAPWVIGEAHRMRFLYGCPVEIVVEDNNGGQAWRFLLENAAENLRVRCPDIHEVTAVKAKIVRADAVGNLYEQRRVHHCGVFPELERQMSKWIPGMPSPDRMDALVHMLTQLSGTSPTPSREASRPTGI